MSEYHQASISDRATTAITTTTTATRQFAQFLDSEPGQIFALYEHDRPDSPLAPRAPSFTSPIRRKPLPSNSTVNAASKRDANACRSPAADSASSFGFLSGSPAATFSGSGKDLERCVQQRCWLHLLLLKLPLTVRCLCTCCIDVPAHSDLPAARRPFFRLLLSNLPPSILRTLGLRMSRHGASVLIPGLSANPSPSLRILIPAGKLYITRGLPQCLSMVPRASRVLRRDRRRFESIHGTCHPARTTLNRCPRHRGAR